MATTQPYLEITDGVSSVKLMDSTLTTAAQIATLNYRLTFGGWAPKIAHRNKGPFGLPYMPVMEEMTIDVRGATPDAALLNLQTLNNLLDQAERWFNNEVVNPVFIRYQPKGSVKSTYLQDVIIGRGIGDQSDGSMIDAPNDFNVVGDMYWIRGIRIRFWRRMGTWLCETATKTLTNQSQRSIMTVTWDDNASVLSPLELDINTTSAIMAARGSGVVVTTHDDTYIGLRNGENIGGTLTADATNNAVGGNVGRFTCSTVTVEAFWDTIAEHLLECEYVALYATLKNNSTTLDVYLQAAMVIGNKYTYFPEIKIAFAASPKPQVVFLGIFPTGGRQPQRFSIFYRSLSGAPTFDIDQVAHIGVNRATNIIALPDVAAIGASSTNVMALAHRLLLEPQPEISNQKPALGIFEEKLNYSGSGYMFTAGTKASQKTALLLFIVQDTKWQMTTNLNAALNIDPVFRRYKAYLVPE